ncbi:MAG: aldo/keto reductase [Acidobacteria bacterium]|nr:aldo/keto reductase [Acidobacteriota bacterium]
MKANLNRRQFVAGAVAATGGLMAAKRPAATANPLNTSSILNYNPEMEYRRLGKTGLMVSAVCLGGHWKRVARSMQGPFQGVGYSDGDLEHIQNPEFRQNRHSVVSRCIERGINYLDACAPAEIMAYSTAVKGRRDKMYFGFSWHTREPRYTDWRNSKKLVQGLETSLREAGLDHIDLWRISLPMEQIADLGELLMVEEATVQALELAKKQGKARFTGVSSHNRTWLKSIIEQYPQQIEAVLFPYTAGSKELPGDSIFDAVKAKDVGVFGIKPFADNSLFAGDSAPNSPHAEEDDRRARLAIRYILGNPAITAPIPGMVNTHQVDNVAQAVIERRKLDRKEKAELDRHSAEMWTRLSPTHQWLRDWEYV